jgi:hypothetical protein
MHDEMSHFAHFGWNFFRILILIKTTTLPAWNTHSTN